MELQLALPGLQPGGGQPAELVLRMLRQRAAFLPSLSLLLVADLHFGKAHSFRRLGVPVPGGTTAGSLARLDSAVADSGARHIVFLGDLLHSAGARAPATLAAVARWREQHADLQLTLVRGNHDGHAGDPPADWGVHCVDEPWQPPGAPGLVLCHHPQPVADAYVLAGHTHPAVLLGGRAHERLRLPCFHFGPAVGVLPAFGEFTGMHVVRKAPGDRVYAVSPDAVHAVP
jgi:uncharacterized protein